jgi:hypothetical protein
MDLSGPQQLTHLRGLVPECHGQVDGQEQDLVSTTFLGSHVSISSTQCWRESD